MKYFKNSCMGDNLFAKCAVFKVVGLAVLVGVLFCGVSYAKGNDYDSIPKKTIQRINNFLLNYTISHPTKDMIEDGIAERIQVVMDRILKEDQWDGYCVVDVQLKGVSNGRIGVGGYKGDAVITFFSAPGYYASSQCGNLSVFVERGYYNWSMDDN